MLSVVTEVRQGARRLWKAPGFTAVALLTLSLGIGATTAIFSVVDAVVIKPLPFREPGRVVVVWEKNPSQNRFRMFVAAANFEQWRQQAKSFEGIAAVYDTRQNLTGGPNGRMDAEELKAERVSAAIFPLLGVQAVVGRTFRPEEDRPGHANFVVLSHSLWTRRFGADPAIAGKAIRLRDQSYTVVGVLPAGFGILNPSVDVYVPLAFNPNDPRMAVARVLMTVARLKPGATLEQAQKEMETIGDRLEQANPTLNRGWRPAVYSIQNELFGDVQKSMWVLLGAVLFLLLMACANVANLLLAKGATRQKEIAVRTALGASRAQVAAQFLVQSVLLALVGGALGIALAEAAISLAVRLGPATIPRLANATVDLRLLLFAGVASILTGLLFGAGPALVGSRANLQAILTEGGRGGTSGRTGRLVRNALVVAEMALAVMVLIGAGLLMRSFVRLRAANPGFESSGLLTFRLPLGGGRNAAIEKRIAFFQRVTGSLETLPGVQRVGAVSSLPLTGLGVGTMFAIDGRPAPPSEKRPMGLSRGITNEYFHAMGIPLVAGRFFNDADTLNSTPVVIIDQTLAKRFFPHSNPIGGRVITDANEKVEEIVGVVGAVNPDRLGGEDWPTIYMPYPQKHDLAMTFTLRTAGAPLAMAPAVQRAIRELDPEQPVADIRSMDQVVDEAVAGTRFNTVALGLFAIIAFALAGVGIYGVISCDVTARTGEIGIRVALGAERGHVLQLVLGQAARLAAYGILIGLAGALGLTRFMASMLFGVQPIDLYTFAAIAALLAAVALLASYLPTRRAMALDPMTALRHE